jgi:hypothetical protein
MSLIITAGLMLKLIYMPGEFQQVKLAFLIFIIAFPAVIAGLYIGQVTYHQPLLVINDTYDVWVPRFWWVMFGIVWRNTSLADNNYAYSKLQSFPDHRFKQRF